MVIITNANGDVVKNISENIYQGSNNANSIVVLAPFASSSQLTIAYRLPDGVLTEPALMTPYEDVPSEYDLSGWYINLDEAITEKYGNVDFQVRATTNTDTVVASFGFNFTVLRGVPPILPAEPSETIYEQILTALASIEADIINGWLESKGILPYDETFTYSLNTVLYSNNTFYKSKIPDNVGNPLSDTDSWEEILFATEQEVADLIQAHNISETAHNDIRLILAGLIDGTYPIDSCANVSETINDINITDIFESNGITVKSATNAKNDALGNDIGATYSKILDIINNVNSTDIDKPLSANQGKVLQEQITALSGSLVPQGNWDASTNTPNISETTTTGHYWIVSVAGTTDFGGITDWQVNDWIVKTSTSWAKIDNSDNTKMEKITSNYIYVDTETMIADELNIQEGQIVKGGEIYYVYLGTTNSSIGDFGMIGGGDNWINYASESFESGTGIELDPYIITSPEQLAYLSKLVNSGLNQSGVYFKLNNNIDLSKKQWTPIGYLTVDFSGTFLGNNKIINGLTNISTSIRGMGLFGSNAGTIKDLELRNTFICGYQYVGGIVGFNSGVISNCINNGVVMALYEGGGIAGTTLNTIEYCINYSTLIGDNTGNGYFGGIAGSAHNGIYVKNCINFGDILGTESYVGGIVGSLSGGHIYYSYNLGNIFGNDRVGGIVGVIWSTTPSSSIFECYNIGRVKGLTNVGGVYGINDGNSYSSYYLENIIEGENDSTGLNKTLTEIRNLVADGILDNTYWEDDVNITGMLTPALKSINYNLQNNSKYIAGRAIQENIITSGGGIDYLKDPDKTYLVIKTPADNDTFTLLTGTTGSPNYTIEWGDGTSETITTTDNPSHEYETAGMYLITISGAFTNGIAYGVLYNLNKDKIIEVYGGSNHPLSIGDDAFYNCPSLTIVSFPNVTSIGDFAFAGCSSLTTANIPNATSIENNAFGDCLSLTTVTFPNATSIGNNVFQGCTSLTTASIPNTTSLGHSAFYYCSSLKELTLGNVITSASGLRFENVKLIDLKIAQNATDTDINRITTFFKANGGTFIGTEAKHGLQVEKTPTADNDVVRKIDLDTHTSNTSNPHTVTKSQVGLSNAYNPTAYGGVSYGGGAGESGVSFTDLNSLVFTGFYTCFGTTANVPSSSYSWYIQHINSNVGNVSATQIAIAYGTTTIIYKRNKTSSTWGAWENISPSLKENVVNKVTSISSSSTDTEYPTAKCVYDIVSGAEISPNGIDYLKDPDKTYLVIKTPADNDTFTLLTGTTGSPNYTIEWGDGISEAVTTTDNPTHEYETAGMYLITISGSFENGIEYGVSANVNKDKIIEVYGGSNYPLSIGNSAFQGCTNLTTANFPQATSTGNYAFHTCTNLTTANFPQATSIGNGVFISCLNLTTANFPQATFIGGNAFYNCSNLTAANFPKVTTITSAAFDNCTFLKELMIGNVTTTATGTAFANVKLVNLTIAQDVTNTDITRIKQFYADNGGTFTGAQINSIE